MSTFSKQEVFNLISKTGIVPIFYHNDVETCKEVVTAAYEAGIRVFEFANRGDNAFELFLQLKRYRDSKFKDLALGMGTIFTTHDTRKFISAGADFIVSPIFKKEIANECNKAFKFLIPGCATLTEIVVARDAGAILVKLFPAHVLGSSFVRSVLTPIPDLKLMATGGISTNKESIDDWFKAGVVCLGLEDQLLDRELIEKKDYGALQKNIKDVLKIVQGHIV